MDAQLPGALERACSTDNMKGKGVLCPLDSNRYDSYGLPLISQLIKSLHTPSWHFVVSHRNLPGLLRLPWDGEVPFIH